MRLTLRFVLLMAALLATAMASAAIGLGALHQLDAALTRSVDKDAQRLIAIAQARRSFGLLQLLERDVLLAPSEGERASIEQKLENVASDLQAQLHSYAGLMPDTDTRMLAELDAASARWLELDGKVRAAAHAAMHVDAPAVAKQHEPDQRSWETAAAALVERNERRLAQQLERSHRDYSIASAALAGLTIVTLLTAAFGYALWRDLRRTLAQVARLQGQLTVQRTPWPRFKQPTPVETGMRATALGGAPANANAQRRPRRAGRGS
jgi:Four helix bundle sensory module for signal transduction